MNQTVVRGPSFSVLLTLLFIALRLTGVIAWPWIWVLAPFWIAVILGTTAVLVLLTLAWIGDTR